MEVNFAAFTLTGEYEQQATQFKQQIVVTDDVMTLELPNIGFVATRSGGLWDFEIATGARVISPNKQNIINEMADEAIVAFSPGIIFV